MAVAKALPGDAAEERALVSCLLLRAAYGGMAGDVSMLHTAAAVWLQRFQEHPGPQPAQPPTEGGTLRPDPAVGVDSPWGALWAAVFPAEAIPWTVWLPPAVITGHDSLRCLSPAHAVRQEIRLCGGDVLHADSEHRRGSGGSLLLLPPAVAV